MPITLATIRQITSDQAEKLIILDGELESGDALTEDELLILLNAVLIKRRQHARLSILLQNNSETTINKLIPILKPVVYELELSKLSLQAIQKIIPALVKPYNGAQCLLIHELDIETIYYIMQNLVNTRLVKLGVVQLQPQAFQMVCNHLPNTPNFRFDLININRETLALLPAASDKIKNIYSLAFCNSDLTALNQDEINTILTMSRRLVLHKMTEQSIDRLLPSLPSSSQRALYLSSLSGNVVNKIMQTLPQCSSIQMLALYLLEAESLTAVANGLMINTHLQQLEFKYIDLAQVDFLIKALSQNTSASKITGLSFTGNIHGTMDYPLSLTNCPQIDSILLSMMDARTIKQIMKLLIHSKVKELSFHGLVHPVILTAMIDLQSYLEKQYVFVERLLLHNLTNESLQYVYALLAQRKLNLKVVCGGR